MTTCYQKHPFEIESEDHLTSINTKIFEVKKKIQLSEGQRKSNYEENEAEKQQNNDLIDTLKNEIKIRLQELTAARAVVGDDEVTVKKYLNDVCPIGNKTTDQIIHNLDLKVIEQRKQLDLLKYERKAKKTKLKNLEKEYEHILIESTKSVTEKAKNKDPVKKRASHLENEIHKVLIQWNEAELVKKKYSSIRKALIEDSVKFESSLSHIAEVLTKQREEIAKLEHIRSEAAEMRLRATAALTTATAQVHDAERSRAAERTYFAQRFDERKRELEKLEKRIFPPQARTVVRQDSSGSTEAAVITEEASAATLMEDIFIRLMKLTGVTDPEEVFDRFQAQRETCKRLKYLQQTTEEEKLELENVQASLINELEAFKFASVKEKDDVHDQIAHLKDVIKEEVEKLRVMEKKLEDINNLLMEIKMLLYDLCKLLDIIPDPPMPEWTAEARDIQHLVQVLTARYEGAMKKTDDVRARRGDVTPVMPSNREESDSSIPRRAFAPRAYEGRKPFEPPSGTTSAAGVSTHNTPRETEVAVPAYRDLVQREPVKGPPSDEEEDCPSRSYLKRQAQLIVDTKSRRKGFRPPYPRK